MCVCVCANVNLASCRTRRYSHKESGQSSKFSAEQKKGAGRRPVPELVDIARHRDTVADELVEVRVLVTHLHDLVFPEQSQGRA